MMALPHAEDGVFQVDFFHLLQRQGTEEIETAANLHGHLSYLFKFFLLGSLEVRRIGIAPMGNDRLTRPYWAAFLGVVANGDDKIKLHVLKLLPRLAPGVESVNMEVFLQNPQHDGIYFPGGFSSGAKRVKAARID